MSCECCCAALLRRIEELEAENQHVKDQILRSLAETENVRRAVMRVVNGD